MLRQWVDTRGWWNRLDPPPTTKPSVSAGRASRASTTVLPPARPGGTPSHSPPPLTLPSPYPIERGMFRGNLTIKHESRAGTRRCMPRQWGDMTTWWVRFWPRGRTWRRRRTGCGLRFRAKREQVDRVDLKNVASQEEGTTKLFPLQTIKFFP